MKNEEIPYTDWFTGGLRDSSQVLEMGKGEFTQVFVFSAAEDAELFVYDSPDILNLSNDDILARARCSAAQMVGSVSLNFPLKFITGLTCILSGAEASYLIIYRIEKKRPGEKGKNEKS